MIIKDHIFASILVNSVQDSTLNQPYKDSLRVTVKHGNDLDSNSLYGSLIAIGARPCLKHHKKPFFILECKKSLFSTGLSFDSAERVVDINQTASKRKTLLHKFSFSLIKLDTKIEESDIDHNNQYCTRLNVGCWRWKSKNSPGFDLIQPAIISKTNQKTKKFPQFRLLCNRKTFSVAVYASNVDLKGSIVLDDRKSMLWQTEKSEIDGFVENTVFLYKPSRKRWYEISVLGNCFTPRQTPSHLPKKVSTCSDNILEENSLIHSGGVTFKWVPQKVEFDYRQNQGFIDFFSSKICPITLEPIPSAHVASTFDICTCTTNTFSNPFSSSFWLLGSKSRQQQLSIDRFRSRPFYFTGCGYSNYLQFSHVFSFQDRLQGHFGQCPICRTGGFFRPIQAAASLHPIEILDSVLIPCGHIFSKEECIYWASKIILPLNTGDKLKWDHLCPICGISIDRVQSLYFS